MSTTLDYDLKKVPQDLFEHGRWDVLTQMIIHTNERNRCWPTVRRIGTRASKSLETVNEAKKWLKSVGAIVDVPFDQRIGKEREIPKRQCVYELTGSIKIGDKEYPYLYVEKVDHGDTEDVTPSETSVPPEPVDVTPSETKDVTPSRISEGVTKVYTYSTSNPETQGNQDSSLSAVVPTPTELDVPYRRIASSEHGSLIHIAKSASGPVLCRDSVQHRCEPNQYIGQHLPCPRCQVIYDARSKQAPRQPRKTAINQALLDAIAVEVEGIEPKMATELTGLLAARVGKVWCRKFGWSQMTQERYEKAARSIAPFVKWFKEENDDYPPSKDLKKFESAYSGFVVSLDKKPIAPLALVPHPDDPTRMIKPSDRDRILLTKKAMEDHYGHK